MMVIYNFGLVFFKVCADNNHVRTWTVTRFRGMISTQPGSTPLASFKIISLEETESHNSYSSGNDIGERFDCSFPPDQVQEGLKSCYFPPLSCELNNCYNRAVFTQVHLESETTNRCLFRKSFPLPTNSLFVSPLRGRGTS